MQQVLFAYSRHADRVRGRHRRPAKCLEAKMPAVLFMAHDRSANTLLSMTEMKNCESKKVRTLAENTISMHLVQHFRNGVHLAELPSMCQVV